MYNAWLPRDFSLKPFCALVGHLATWSIEENWAFYGCSIQTSSRCCKYVIFSRHWYVIQQYKHVLCFVDCGNHLVSDRVFEQSLRIHLLRASWMTTSGAFVPDFCWVLVLPRRWWMVTIDHLHYRLPRARPIIFYLKSHFHSLRSEVP